MKENVTEYNRSYESYRNYRSRRLILQRRQAAIVAVMLGGRRQCQAKGNSAGLQAVVGIQNNSSENYRSHWNSSSGSRVTEGS